MFKGISMARLMQFSGRNNFSSTDDDGEFLKNPTSKAGLLYFKLVCDLCYQLSRELLRKKNKDILSSDCELCAK